MTLSVASLPSELSVLHPGPWPAPASWRRGQPSPSHRGTPCRATAAGSTWSRGGRPGRGDAWQKGWEWRWCWWKAARHRVSLTWTCPRWPPSLLRGSPGWFWCAGGGTQACPAKHTSAASRSTQSVCFGDYYQMDYCFFFFFNMFKRGSWLTSCTSWPPKEPGYLVTSSGLRSRCHIWSRLVWDRAALTSSCDRVRARW